LQSASRLIDQQARRKFYPRVETQVFDIPDGREIWFYDDLLACSAVTNGDTTAITDYLLEDYNHPPYYALKLKDWTSQFFVQDSNGGSENVIQVTGEWGYHDEYTQRAWISAGTLGAAITDTTGLSATLTAGHTAATGRIFKIGSEIFTGSVATNTLTIVKRGDNGSTAATHLNGSALLMWSPMDIIHDACLQMTHQAYIRRSGLTDNSAASQTDAGAVVSPGDIPGNVMRALRDLRSLV